jgi:hypothetical protein
MLQSTLGIKVVSDKHSSLLDSFINHDVKEVL